MHLAIVKYCQNDDRDHQSTKLFTCNIFENVVTFLFVCVHTYMCGHIRHDAHVEVRRLGLVVFFSSHCEGPETELKL